MREIDKLTLALLLGSALAACGGEGPDVYVPPYGSADSSVATGTPDTGVAPGAPGGTTGGLGGTVGMGGNASMGGTASMGGGVPEASVSVRDAGSDAAPPGAGGGGDAGDGGSAGGAEAGSDGGGSDLKGECCADGNCLCHGPAPTALTSAKGPFKTASIDGMTGKIHYPTDAQPPFAAVALCGGFLNSGPEMDSWGPFYASYGIVTIITGTLPTDFPEIRADHLLNSIKELEAKNKESGSPLFGKLSGRYGTSGYSMGGGGTTHASTRNKSLKTSVGLAAWSPVGAGITVPTLLLCGSSDGTAPCSQSQGSYRGIPEATPKMMVSISGATHFSWFGPTDAGGGVSGKYALAFQKVYLEGDERWKPILKMMASGGTVTTNVK
jgi:predicted small lipoprotein YifL/pimeloyl-ACP methyl ester carboxylesterase